MLRTIGKIAAIGVVVAAVSGIGYAATPSADGTLRACYDNVSGQLRITDPEDGSPKECGSKETEISWNQQGQPGAQGPAGPAGPAGPQGPVGPSNVYWDAEQNVMGITSDWTTILSLDVPAGSYVSHASFWTANDSPTMFARLNCLLVGRVPGQPALGTQIFEFIEPEGAGDPDSENVAATAVHQLNAAGTITLECRNHDAPGSAVDLFDLRLNAIKIGSLAHG